MKRITLLTALLSLVSCAPMNHYRRTVITTTTKTCPKDHMYNMYDDLCHYSKLPKQTFESIETLTSHIRPNKPVKRLKTSHMTNKEQPINCVKALHYCGVNNGRL